MRRLAHIPLVATLAVATSFNIVSASVLAALLQRPFPFPKLEQLVLVRDARLTEGAHQSHAIAAADFFDVRSSVSAFSAVSAYRGAPLVISNDGTDPEGLQGVAVTADFLSTLGVAPIVGSAWAADADTPGHDRVVLLSQRFWRSRFGADQTAIGRDVTLNGRRVRLMGVVRDQDCYPAGVDAWIPLVLSPAERLERGAQRLTAIARLRGGAAVGEARAQLAATAARLRSQYPSTNDGRGFDLLPLRREQYEFAAPLFAFAQAAALIVLLLGILNVTLVLAARQLDRAAEFSIRSMLGATPGDLGRLIVGETALLTGAATTIGVAASWPVLHAVRASLPDGVARWINGWSAMRVDGQAVVVGIGVGLMTTAVIGSALALGARRRITLTAPGERIVRGGSLGRRLIVGSEIALASALLLCAFAVLRAVDRQMSTFSGFAPDRLLRFTLSLPASRYDDDTKVGTFHARMLEAIKQVPGIEAAALIRNEPASNVPSPLVTFDRVDAPARTSADGPRADLQTVSPAAFSVLHILVLGGRGLFTTDDQRSTRIAIVSQKAAERFWPGRSPIGALIHIDPDPSPVRIVGIVADVELNWYDGGTRPTIYVPDAQVPARSTTVVARTDLDPLVVAPTIREAVAKLDSALAIGGLESLSTSVGDSLSPIRIVDRMLVSGAALATLLAGMGVFGVLAHAVGRRIREFGVRFALGATPRGIAGVILRDALATGALGLMCGLALGAVGIGVVGNSLFGLIGVTLGSVLAVSAGTLLLVVAAALLPTVRASRIDAAALLRH